MNNGGSRGRRLKRQNSWLAWDSRITAPFIKLDLVIECRRLPKKDSFSNADAFCGIWEAPPGVLNNRDKQKVSQLPNKQEREIGRTEVVRENENPCFEHTFRLEFRFQEQQCYVIRVYNEDLRYATDLKEHDFIGGCVFTLGELIGSPGCAIAKPLQQGKAYTVLMGQEIVETREVLEFRFAAASLGSLDHKAKKQGVAQGVANTMSDFCQFYFRLEKLLEEDQSWTVVWKSEIQVDYSQTPTWQVARIPLQLLCDDKPTNPLKISVWEWNRITADEFIGFVETTVRDLVEQARRGIPVFDVMLEKKKLLGGTRLKKNGILKILKSNILTIPSMLQFLSGGCELDFMVAIDCTTANGDWREDKSLHYISDSWLNDYQAALIKVGSVFDGYGGEKGYIMWGYGGKLLGAASNSPSYFAMAENIRGADNLVKIYDKVFAADNKSLGMKEDGALRPIIEAAMFRATNRNKEGRQCYAVLVILTTGAISDVQDSIDTICAAADDSPLSIAVIGIGESDFVDAQKLVGGEDGKLHHSNGVPIARNNISFATMADFGGNARDCVGEVFQDVPEQFVQYFMQAGIKPLPPKAIPDFTYSEVFGKKKSSSSTTTASSSESVTSKTSKSKSSSSKSSKSKSKSSSDKSSSKKKKKDKDKERKSSSED
ncbi:hypothetical protein ACA910_009082 [Epithemia clementina (nom. ined.)]